MLQSSVSLWISVEGLFTRKRKEINLCAVICCHEDSRAVSEKFVGFARSDGNPE